MSHNIDLKSPVARMKLMCMMLPYWPPAGEPTHQTTIWAVDSHEKPSIPSSLTWPTEQDAYSGDELGLHDEGYRIAGARPLACGECYDLDCNNIGGGCDNG